MKTRIISKTNKMKKTPGMTNYDATKVVSTEEFSPKTEMIGTMGGLAVLRCEGCEVEGHRIKDGLYLSMGSVLMSGPFKWPEDIRAWLKEPENMLALTTKVAAVVKDWGEFRLNGLIKTSEK